MMRRGVVIGLMSLMALMVILGCKEVSREQQAAEAALSYYSRFLEGYPDGVVAGKAMVDSMDGDYRQQLAKAHEKYLADIKQKHGGLKNISISNNVGRSDSIEVRGQKSEVRKEPIVYAFLLLTFCDSTQEEIVVPMVERDGDWLLR